MKSIVVKNKIKVISMYFNYFTFKECFPNCTDSEISIALNDHCIDSLAVLLSFLDSFREFLNAPIIITSGFRDFAHNKRVQGSATSQHMLGEAVDFKSSTLPIESVKLSLKDFLNRSSLERFIGQVIFYPSFIHIGLRNSSHNKLVIHEKGNNQIYH